MNSENPTDAPPANYVPRVIDTYVGELLESVDKLRTAGGEIVLSDGTAISLPKGNDGVGIVAVVDSPTSPSQRENRRLFEDFCNDLRVEIIEVDVIAPHAAALNSRVAG